MATKPFCLACLLTSFAVLPVQAEDTVAQPEARPIMIGATTEALLGMQREGASAGSLHPVNGEVASRSYRRYLDSFDKPMPEFKETIGSSVKSNSGAAQ